MSNVNSKIAVGDLVIMQNATYYEEWNEMPAVVVSCQWPLILTPYRPVKLTPLVGEFLS